ncbi:ABC transporter ATP-binding protein [Arboricoccus pini]|uniref:ABC transporter ATP-binding protein n=1 Tax=Arboricoccus pini TaxID=1963835 RepID=UPI000B506BA2|nr:ABC transporter ATP-binding protein [Arboricoccus pini]
MSGIVRLEQVSRHFGATRAVDAVDLTITEGEFFAMLGPSGSGKTTCLRLIGGFEQPDSGHIVIDGQRAEGLPPYRRPVNTVFQDYALFPHMSVGQNVAYGLKVRGQGRAERDREALDALRLVRLDGLADRRPSQLSGGQRQRVALARALVLHPKVLLLDEPLGALDLKLREEMQVELKSLQRRLGLTFVFVTHDQGEALSMADRVAVFDRGKVAQLGTPEDVHDRPRTRFVAGFVGAANVLEPAVSAALGGPEALVSLRPEKIGLLAPDTRPRDDALEARIVDISYQGAFRRLQVELRTGMRLSVQVAASISASFSQGMVVWLNVPSAAFNLLEAD